MSACQMNQPAPSYRRPLLLLLLLAALAFVLSRDQPQLRPALDRMMLALATAGAASTPAPAPQVGTPRRGTNAIQTANALAAPAADPQRELLLVRAENRRLRQDMTALLRWLLDNFKGKYPVPDAQMKNLQIPALDDADRLTPAVAELLHLTPDERGKLDDLMTGVRDQFAEIEGRLITVTNTEDGAILIRVPAFPEEGRQLQTLLKEGATQTLGPVRSDRFVQAADNSLQDRFQHFGQAARSLRFTLETDPANNEPVLAIRDAWVMDKEQGERIIQAREFVPTEFPEKYRAYLQYLPQEVTQFVSRASSP